MTRPVCRDCRNGPGDCPDHGVRALMSEAPMTRPVEACEWCIGLGCVHCDLARANAELLALRAENERLRKALAEACDGWEESNQYVSDYFRAKWGLDDRCAECRAALDGGSDGLDGGRG